MKKNVSHSPRLLELKKQRRRVFVNKIALSLSALVLIIVCLIYLYRIPSLNISDIEVNGNKVVDAGIIKTAIQKEINGNYLWIFPKTNIFFYPSGSIKKELSQQFKRIETVNLSIKNNKILEVSMTERTALYTWCGTNLVVGVPSGTPTTNIVKCYFMDNNGFIFDQAPYISGEVYFKFYGGVDIDATDPSGSYFSHQNFTQLISFKQALEAIGLKPVELYVTTDGDMQVYLSKKEDPLSIGPEIILKADADLPTTAENLETALHTEPLQSNFKNKYSSLLYIDLRYGNKVYYKFK